MATRDDQRVEGRTDHDGPDAQDDRDQRGEREERLRRELRAAAAVNRQLRAQLDGTPGRAPSTGPTAARPGLATGPRRAGQASLWLDSLALAPRGNSPTLVRGRDGSRWVIDGGARRPVRSTLLANTLEHHLGAPRLLDASQERLPEGPPVELLEGSSGAPFVVVGGVRREVRGLPLPHPVTNAEIELFRPGPPLDAVAANVARSRYRRALTGRAQLDLARRELRRQGPIKGARALLGKVRGRRRGASSVRR